METPFSGVAFTEQTQRDLNATRTLQVLLLDPSVADITASSDPQSELSIRGFQTVGNVASHRR